MKELLDARNSDEAANANRQRNCSSWNCEANRWNFAVAVAVDGGDDGDGVGGDEKTRKRRLCF